MPGIGAELALEIERRKMNTELVDRLSRMETMLEMLKEDHLEYNEAFKRLSTQIEHISHKNLQQEQIIKAWQKERKLVLSIVAALFLYIAQQVTSSVLQDFHGGFNSQP